MESEGESKGESEGESKGESEGESKGERLLEFEIGDGNVIIGQSSRKIIS
jgi:hypothetical protein